MIDLNRPRNPLLASALEPDYGIHAHVVLGKGLRDLWKKSGRHDVEVTVTVEMPWIARLFRGAVEDFITRQAAIVTGLPNPA